MEFLKSNENLNIILNQEQDIQNNLGWQESMMQFEDEVLSSIINPIENYETVRFIHKPYDTSISGLTLSQTDIWYNFYFLSGNTYVTDYNAVGIDTHENAKMLKATTKSFFRLEFFKTPITDGVVESPTRINRKLVFAKNLSLPLGEKYFYNGNNINENIHFPIFMGSNYKNKENMYLFWFQDESVLSETVLSGDTFFMTAKFYNAEDGSITDFVNNIYTNTREIVDTTDMYYKVVIDRSDYSYTISKFTGTSGDRVGNITGVTHDNSIKFYERGGIPVTPTPTPTPTVTVTPVFATPTPTITPTHTITPTITPTPTVTQSQGSIIYNYYQYDVTRSSIPNADGGYFTYIDINGTTQTVLQNTYGYVGRYCMREGTYQNNQYNLYSISQVGACNPGGGVDDGFTNANITIQPNTSCSTGYDHTDGQVQFVNIGGTTAPYTVYMSGQTGSGWTMVASGITENGSTSLITNLNSDNGVNPGDGTNYSYTYAVRVVDANGGTKITPSSVIFNCPTYEAIDFSLTSTCVGYSPTGATITVSGATGGSGTGYYCVITSGPEGFDDTHHSLPFTYTGLTNYVGNTYAISVYDDEGHGGNKALTEDLTCDDPPNVTLTVYFQYEPYGTTPTQGSWSTSISVELNSSTATFCDATTYTSTSFIPYGQTNNLWIYDGTNYRRLYHTTGGGTVCVPASSCSTY
jgi:hypothetical protein